MTKATDYFMNGYSCSESVLQVAVDKGLCPAELLPCATSFSGGMARGCACGALMALQIVVGYNYGRNNSKGNEVLARTMAGEIVDEFKKRNGVTCCKILAKGLEGLERKKHCCKMVNDAEEILENLLGAKV